MSTWDSMSDADYAACVDAGRGPGRDVRDEADQLRKANREAGAPVFSGAGACVICHLPTVGSVRGEPLCGDCERQMAADLTDDRPVCGLCGMRYAVPGATTCSGCG